MENKDENIYNLLFLTPMVNLRNVSSNNPDVSKQSKKEIKSRLFWNEIGEEIIKLDKILNHPP